MYEAKDYAPKAIQTRPKKCLDRCKLAENLNWCFGIGHSGIIFHQNPHVETLDY